MDPFRSRSEVKRTSKSNRWFQKVTEMVRQAVKGGRFPKLLQIRKAFLMEYTGPLNK